MIKLYPFNEPEIMLLYEELKQKERMRKLTEQEHQNENSKKTHHRPIPKKLMTSITEELNSQ